MGDPLKEKVHIFGVGEDGVLSMHLKAMRLLQDAEWIFGPERLLAHFPNHDAKKIPIRSNLKEIAGMIQSNLGRRQMAVLAAGDPNFNGIARDLVGELGKGAIEIIPNVGAMQLAFARIKEGWEGAYLGSVRNRPIEEIIEPIRHAGKAGLLTDEENTPSTIAGALLQGGIGGRTAFVCENVGGNDERITETELERLPGRRFSPRTILILIKRSRAGGKQPGAPATEATEEEGRI